jgi:proline iminopeptidase
MLLDPRGTGASDRPADPHAYDLEDYAADVEAIREHLGLERLGLLGHSHGGFVAMTWATTYPERVGRLVLSNTAPRFTDEIRARRRAIIDSYRDEPWFEDALASLNEHPDGVYADDATLAASVERRAPFHFHRWDEDAKAVASILQADGPNADALSHFNARVAAGMDHRTALAHLEAPTLVITGEHDPFGESTAREIADALLDATVAVFPDAGHFTYAETGSRGAWARAILDFLSA